MSQLSFFMLIARDKCFCCVTDTSVNDFVVIYPRTKNLGSCHKRQKPQAPTSQAPVRNRQTRKKANARGLNHNTNLT